MERNMLVLDVIDVGIYTIRPRVIKVAAVLRFTSGTRRIIPFGIGESSHRSILLLQRLFYRIIYNSIDTNYQTP